MIIELLRTYTNHNNVINNTKCDLLYAYECTLPSLLYRSFSDVMHYGLGMIPGEYFLIYR